ncbi:hypothetical protein [Candidatus Albibeggiatoa sp. nov. BB20]|uniref:hypothetical protein n=1 Tax=Candidatus Albibeggiatoa sp. nov. BB20 TaxID=3162723 RepID=UPI003365ACAD
MSNYNYKVPFLSTVQRSACCAVAPWGRSCLGVSVRDSSRSVSGQVAIVAFSSGSAAGRFSVVWAGRLPSFCRGCVVRRGWLFGSPAWFVSVPFLSLIS